MLKNLISLLNALNANSKPNQIANSFCIGLLLGFLPKQNLFWFAAFFFFAFVRINKGGYYIFLLTGSLFAPFLDHFFDLLGYYILTFEPLQNFYAALLEIPFIGFTKFNNTIVMGSFAFGLIIYMPFFFVTIFAVKLWRKLIAQKMTNPFLQKIIGKIPLAEKLISE